MKAMKGPPGPIPTPKPLMDPVAIAAIPGTTEGPKIPMVPAEIHLRMMNHLADAHALMKRMIKQGLGHPDLQCPWHEARTCRCETKNIKDDYDKFGQDVLESLGRTGT